MSISKTVTFVIFICDGQRHAVPTKAIHICGDSITHYREHNPTAHYDHVSDVAATDVRTAIAWTLQS